MRFRLVPKSLTLDALNCYKFNFSRNFALLRIIGRQQRLTLLAMELLRTE